LAPGVPCDVAMNISGHGAGSETARLIGETYEHSYERLRRLSSRYETHDPDDLVHDAFVKALEHATHFRHASQPATWLHRITQNTCVDHWRKRRRRPEEQPLDPGELASHAHTPIPGDALMVRRALQRLSAGDRALCIRRFVVGYSYEELAAELRIPVGTAKSRVSIARRRLRRLVENPEF
jgi:RNA polymerase sigma-70 factor (ECF subfamily)